MNGKYHLYLIKNSKGPSIEPWGTPHFIRPLSEFTFSMETN